MADFYPIGPAVLCIGDPTGTMNKINETEEVNVDIGVQNSFVTTATTAGAPVSSGVYTLPPNPTVQVQLNDADLDQIEHLIPAGKKFTSGSDEAFGFGGDIKTLALDTVALIPVFEKSQGENAPHGIWLPAAFIEGFSNLLFNRMQANASSNNAYQVTIRAARRKQDQGSNAISTEAQYGFIGEPSALGLTWSLPTL